MYTLEKYKYVICVYSPRTHLSHRFLRNVKRLQRSHSNTSISLIPIRASLHLFLPNLRASPLPPSHLFTHEVSSIIA